MNVLFLSSEGSSFPLAMEMLNEGHEVKFYIKKPEDRVIGDGFVPKTKDWQEELDWCDYVICDDTGWGKENDSIRRAGIPVVGGTALSDAVEENRGTGQKMFKALGMDVLPSKDFKNIDEAIRYVRDNPRRYVVKVSGSAQSDKSLTYVGEAEDGSDVEPVLFHMKQKAVKIDAVHVQDRVSGMEVAVGGFFNGQDFLDPVLVNFEHKKLMPSKTEQAGCGPATGEMGTVGCWKDKGFKLYRETLQRFVPVLRQEGYTGYFDINCIVHCDMILAPEKGWHVHPLETTSRFGWPTLPLQMETMKINDLGELFHGMATGTMSDFKVSHPYSVCVVIGVPPLPYKHQELADSYSTGMPVLFKRPDEMEGIYPGDVYCDKGQWCCAGDMGYPAVCAAGADTIDDAKFRAYAKVDNIIVANKMWRNDIGDLVPGKLMDLASFLSYDSEKTPAY